MIGNLRLTIKISNLRMAIMIANIREPIVTICQFYLVYVVMWWRGVVVITTAQLHPTQPELRFCAGSNPVCSLSEIRNGEDL